MKLKLFAVVALILLIAAIAPVSAAYKSGLQGYIYINDTIAYGDFPNTSERLAICQAAGASSNRDDVTPKFILNSSPSQGINAEPLGWSFTPSGLYNGKYTGISIGCTPYTQSPSWMEDSSGNVVFAWWQNVATDRPLEVNFTASPLTGPVPLTVTLTDTTDGATTWNWTVVQMDGRNDFVQNVTAQNINNAQVKLFAVGNWSVTDTITNSSGSYSLTKYAYINVYPNNSIPDSVNFTLTLTPSTIPFNGTMTGTLSGGDSSLVNAISLTSGTGFSANANDPAWVLSSGTWKQYNATSHAYDISWGASMPSSFELTGFTTPGTYTMDAALYPINDSFVIPHATAAFTVQSNGQTKKLTMRAIDGLTSGTIYGATVAVKLPDGTWSNKTQSGSSVEYQIPYGSYIQYTSSATGYYPSGPYYVQILKDSAIDVPMDKIVNTTIGTVQLSVYTMTPSGSAWKALDGVSLRVDPGGFAKTSPASGVSTFTVNNSSTYTVTGQKTGYGTVTRSIAVGSTQASLSIEMYPLTATPTPDPTGPTTAPTIDTRTNAQKQDSMLNMIYNNGEALVGLFLVMIVMGGIQMLGGGGRRRR